MIEQGDVKNYSVVVTSTIFPREARDKSVVKSVYSPEERLRQTRDTIDSLRACGYGNIHLLDNSGHRHREQLEGAFADVQLGLFDHYQYDNKGVSETLLLLDGLARLPDRTPIVKLSGRYLLTRPVSLDTGKYDLGARIYEHARRFGTVSTMSTRCYVTRDKAILQRYLLALLEEIFAYSSRIVGPGSLKRFLVNQFMPGRNSCSFFDPMLSVEAASIVVVRRLGLRLLELRSVGVKGFAGTFDNLAIED